MLRLLFEGNWKKFKHLYAGEIAIFRKQYAKKNKRLRKEEI
jgi:hypothetical protein